MFMILVVRSFDVFTVPALPPDIHVVQSTATFAHILPHSQRLTRFTVHPAHIANPSASFYLITSIDSAYLVIGSQQGIAYLETDRCTPVHYLFPFIAVLQCRAESLELLSDPDDASTMEIPIQGMGTLHDVPVSPGTLEALFEAVVLGREAKPSAAPEAFDRLSEDGPYPRGIVPGQSI
ncbi:hypothetical protein PM082_015646 [Marasmius tenuissimus]|nr:hypothetical protein PM082_015646 [Marasmius tenuissimus]